MTVLTSSTPPFLAAYALGHAAGGGAVAAAAAGAPGAGAVPGSAVAPRDVVELRVPLPGGSFTTAARLDFTPAEFNELQFVAGGRQPRGHSGGGPRRPAGRAGGGCSGSSTGRRCN